MFDAISARDYAVVQGFTLVIAVAFVLVNLVDRHRVHVPRPPGAGAVSEQVEAIVAPIPPRRRRREPVRPVARACGATTLRETLRKRSAVIGLVVLVLLVLMAVFAPLLAPVRAPRGLPVRRRAARAASRAGTCSAATRTCSSTSSAPTATGATCCPG